MLADRIAIMAEGRLRCVGSPLFLKAQSGCTSALSWLYLGSVSALSWLRLGYGCISALSRHQSHPPSSKAHYGVGHTLSVTKAAPDGGGGAVRLDPARLLEVLKKEVAGAELSSLSADSASFRLPGAALPPLRAAFAAVEESRSASPSCLRRGMSDPSRSLR